MTKKELIEALKPFEDNQYIMISLYGELLDVTSRPRGAQIIIQGINEVQSWKGYGPNLIGIVAHLRNKELKIDNGVVKYKVEKII